MSIPYSFSGDYVDCDNTAHTIGVEFGSKFLTIGRHRIKLQIVCSYFRSSLHDSFTRSGIALVKSDFARSHEITIAGQRVLSWFTISQSYSIRLSVFHSLWRNSRHTFNVMASWITEARSLAGPDLVIVLVGNKLDQQATRRQVPYAEASRFAQENGKSKDEWFEVILNCAGLDRLDLSGSECSGWW